MNWVSKTFTIGAEANDGKMFEFDDSENDLSDALRFSW